MAVITRSTADARPTNDFDSLQVKMDVAVLAGQLVYIKSNGNGALAVGTTATPAAARGVASMSCAAGQAVAIITRGLFGGWTGMTPGTNVFVSDTAGEAGDAAGTVSKIIGFARSATDVYIEL